jgi:hypothetical protein
MAKRESRPVVIPAVQQAPVQQQPLVSFDAWWAMMQKRMPAQHHKEVVLADFKARGLSINEPAAVFSKALALYGIKLK